MLITSASMFFNFDSCFDPGFDPDGRRSKVRVCDGSRGGTVGSNPAGSMSVSCAIYVLFDRVHCVGLITRTEESYPVFMSNCV